MRLPEHERKNWIASIFGRKGSGKSYLAKEIAREEPRVIAIDNVGEYDGMHVVEGFEECVRALVAAEKYATFKLAFRTKSIAADLALINLVAKMVKVTLIVEETSKYVSHSYLPEEIEQLVRYGRHQAVNQVYLARRPSEIHRDLTAQSDSITTFVQHEPRDIRYLESFMGQEAYRAPSLAQYQALVYGDEDKMPYAILARKYLNKETD